MTSGMEDQQDGMDVHVEHDLINAIKNNNEREVTRLIEAGADVNQTDGKPGKTALFYANEIHNVSMVCELIQAGSNFNVEEIDAIESLLTAVRNGMTDVVRKLINAGVAVDEFDGEGKNALFEAVSCENQTLIRMLIEEGNAVVNAQDLYGRTPLFYAITKSTEIASYLFQKASYIYGPNLVSILQFFIENCCMNHTTHPPIDKVLELLQNKGPRLEEIAQAIVNIVLCKIPLLLTSVPESYSSENLHSMYHLHGKRESLLNVLKPVSEYIQAKKYARMDSIDELLKLIENEYCSISEVLPLLKELHADPNSADSNGNTALHYATCLPHLGVAPKTFKDMCKMFQDFGVPLTKRNYQGETPLLFCLSGILAQLEEEDKISAMEKMADVCKFLVEHGSNIEERTGSGESIFHFMVKLFQQGLEITDKTKRQQILDETLKLLQFFSKKVKKGKVVNESDDDINSPLHLWAALALKASFQDYTSTISKEHNFKEFLEKSQQYLLNCGALIFQRNKNGETPLHLCNTWSAVELLIRKGANPNDKDSSLRPPLLVAAMRKTFLVYDPQEASHFYPDVQENAKSFFENAIMLELDPFAVDKYNMSVLGILIECKTYSLSDALVDVACALDKDDEECQKILVSLLNAICKDKSLHTLWKPKLAERVLEHAKKRTINVVGETFDVWCETMRLQFSGKELPCKKRRIEEQISKKEETSEKKGPLQIENSVHIDIGQTLRSFGASLSADSYDKLIAIFPEIHTFMNDLQVQQLIPWTSQSNTHKDKLDKVARGQECQEVKSICYYKHAAELLGSFGDFFVGIDKTTSREVAIKRFNSTINQEMINRIAHLDCKQVVRFICPIKAVGFFGIVFELMEGNLDNYFICREFDPSKNTRLCEHLVGGLKYLHQQKILHLHLQPTNVFYKTHPELCLKIADFDHGSTRGWMSPELLKTSPENHSESTNMFSCGLLLHYILSEGKHPFSENNSQVAHEIEANIKNGKTKGWVSLNPEATHLVKDKLLSKGDRLKAEEALNHPLFWSNQKKVDFLIAVSNQDISKISKKLQKNFKTIVKYGSWNDPNYGEFENLYKIMIAAKKSKSYTTSSIVHLIRFIRNAYGHASENPLPTEIKDMLFVNYKFLDTFFPDLVIEVYKVVIAKGWHQEKDEIKCKMNQ